MSRPDAALSGPLLTRTEITLYTWTWDAILLHTEENSHTAEKISGKRKRQSVHTPVSSSFLFPSCVFFKSMTSLEE